MASGPESSLAGTNEWWGPDLTPPRSGDVEEIAGQHTFSVTKNDWDVSLHRSTYLCEPPGMSHGYYKIVSREVVEYFMTSRHDYLITVEWEL